MPDLKGRAQIEERLAEVLAKLGGEVAREVMRLLGDPPRAENLTADVWDDLARRYNGAILPVLESTFTASVGQLMETSGFAVDWALVNERAAVWAREYTYDLVRGINANTQRLLQGAVEDFYRQGLTLRDLRSRLDRAFGPVRAELIAVTETTRAASQGVQLWQGELDKLGVQTVLVWRTNVDERVCPACGPLEGRRQGDGWTNPPPAHVSCRCWINTEVVEAAR